jgi:hypothetical protein
VCSKSGPRKEVTLIKSVETTILDSSYIVKIVETRSSSSESKIDRLNRGTTIPSESRKIRSIIPSKKCAQKYVYVHTGSFMK